MVSGPHHNRIEAMEHRLEMDDIADSEQTYTYDFFKEEKDKLQRLLPILISE
jgi:hypothetical protein